MSKYEWTRQSKKRNIRNGLLPSFFFTLSDGNTALYNYYQCKALLNAEYKEITKYFPDQYIAQKQMKNKLSTSLQITGQQGCS